MVIVHAAMHLEAKPAHAFHRKFPHHHRVSVLLSQPCPHGLDPAGLKELFPVILVDKVADIVVKVLPFVVPAEALVKHFFADEHRIGLRGKLHIIGGHKDMAVGIEEADGALDLPLHLFALHAHLVAYDAVFPPGQLAKGGLHKPVIERVMIDDGGVGRVVRDGAVGTGDILFHDGPVAQVANLDARIAVCHRLVKFHQAKFAVYDINIVFIIYIHPSAPRLFP